MAANLARPRGGERGRYRGSERGKEDEGERQKEREIEKDGVRGDRHCKTGRKAI